MRFIAFLCLLTATASGLTNGTSGEKPVAITESGDAYTLDNGILKAVIDRRTANIRSLVHRDHDFVEGGSGYWSFHASSPRGRAVRFGNERVSSITSDPAENGGLLAEVEIDCRDDGAAESLPVRASLRYALARGSDSLAIYGVLSHGKGAPGFRMVEGRYVLKLNDDLVDHMTIDENRNRRMPSGSDWDHGVPLNTKEARRMTTGIHRGEAEHKYSYSAILDETLAYGWSGTRDRIGIWMLNPSTEYISGGPVKPELTAHLDVNPGGKPVLLNMWHGSHYGGTRLVVAPDETWAKQIGPFFLHLNHAEKHEDLWPAALAAARRHAGDWPCKWITHPEHAARSRGSVRGSIIVKDPMDPTLSVRDLRVGLTVANYSLTDRHERREVDWQRDGKHYQYWTRAGKDGSFHLPAVRPGSYVLRAFAAGVLGEFARADVTVTQGGSLDLGRLVWTPERHGQTLWEIGIPDRSSAEFQGADTHWHWGNYFKVGEWFPDGVDHAVKDGDWQRSWCYIQPPRMTGAGRVLGPSESNIRFELDSVPAGDPLLRIALCGYRGNTRLVVLANDRRIGDSGLLSENGVIHREGIRGHLKELRFPVPAGLLKTGENRITLRVEGHTWHMGVVYDYLRMEAHAD